MMAGIVTNTDLNLVNLAQRGKDRFIGQHENKIVV